MAQIEDIALFDMDGVLCDYNKGLSEELEKLRSPHEPIFYPPLKDNVPNHIRARADLIRKSEDWWENLPKLQLGFDILKVAKEMEYKIMILTAGPRKNPHSWSGKKMWIDKNLGEEVDITITRDKGLVYGKILVDDYPEYVKRWLEWRPRGLVIMPTNNENKNFRHPQVISYNGSNLEEVKRAMKLLKKNQFHNL